MFTLQESMRTLPLFKTQELSNLAYSLTTLSRHHKIAPEWFARFLEQSMVLMQDFNGQELSSLAWSVAKIAEQSDLRPILAAISDRRFGGPDESTGLDWMSALLSSAQLRMHALDLSPQGMTCILLACSRLQHRPRDELLRQMCHYSERQHLRPGGIGYPSAVPPQSLSNLLLALAHLDFRPPNEFMAAFEAAAIHSLSMQNIVGRWTAQNLANVFWALSQLNWTPSCAFTRLHLETTSAMLPSCRPGELLQVLVSLTRLRLKVDRSWLELVCIQVDHHDGLSWNTSAWASPAGPLYSGTLV